MHSTPTEPPTGDATAPGRLPEEPTRLLGRERELGEIAALLGQTRLLTLTGTGGSGKSRLALRVAGKVGGHFRDGVWWIDLSAVDDPAMVEHRVASALNVPERPGQPIRRLLHDHLAGRQCLVVLDNCEHLVAECATIADRLLRSAPGVRLLVTSREPLGVHGEVSWSVPPLALPDPDRVSTVEDLMRSPAVELFVERARAAHPGFVVTDRDVEVLARLSGQLDGIPLAIELAAARVRVLSPAEILDRLGDDLEILADRARTTVPRHRTLTATMDWSYRLLTTDEQRLFRRLAVFPGGFGLSAAEAIGSGGEITRGQVLNLLSALVEKSLVVVDHDWMADTSRYRMLHTVRHYAADKLAASSEAESIRQVHADFFVALAQAAETGLTGTDQRAWMRRLSRDHDNITAALAWLLASGDVVRGLDFAARLGRFWWFAGHFAEGAAWIQAFLDPAGVQAHSPERARALYALGMATALHDASTDGIEVSRSAFNEATDIYREIGDEGALAAVLRDRSSYWRSLAEDDRTRSRLAESAAVAARAGDSAAAASAIAFLDLVAAYGEAVAGSTVTARKLLERSLTALRTYGRDDEAFRCMFLLACVECDAGDAAAARTTFQELLALDPLTVLPYGAGFILDGLARLATVEGQPHRALRLASAARAAHEQLRTSAGPTYEEYVRRGIDPARRLLRPDAETRAYQQGRTMAVPDAIAEGLSPPRSRRARTATAAPPTDLLTVRESQVLRLAAEGLTDAEIGDRLYLSKRTVSHYLGSAYRKLGVSNRTAAIRQARDLDVL